MEKNLDKVEHFKHIMKNGKWHERYILVREKYFIKHKLEEDTICQKMLLEAARKDPAKYVRAEAVRTCNLLGITYKGEPVRLRKMPSLDVVTKMNNNSRKELVFLAAMKTDVQIFPRSKQFSDKELIQISKKLEELYPKFYDILDGYYTNNSPGVINKKLNKKLLKCINYYLQSVSRKRINKYYNAHPERVEIELPEYRSLFVGAEVV